MSATKMPWAPRLPKLNLRRPYRAATLSEWSLLPLRAFLGFTFAYAGLQKLANPNFFIASAPISIQHQLAGAVRFSPIHALLHPLLPYAGLIGMIIAYCEIAIGLGTLLGFCSRLAAIGGALLSFSLFLTVSFHSSPYFTGADIVFFFAWLPFTIAPGGRQLSLDGYLDRVLRTKRSVPVEELVALPFAQVQELCGKFDRGTCATLAGACNAITCPVLVGTVAPIATPVAITAVDRRRVVVAGATAGALGTATLLLGGTVAALGKMVGGASSSTTTNTVGTTGTTGATTSTTAAGAGTLIGKASAVPLGSAAVIQSLPSTGDPGIVFHLADGSWRAFDTVCPHNGCTVGWSQGSSLMVCPCHGSQFQVSNGDVINGPAPHGLTEFTVEERGGDLYLL